MVINDLSSDEDAADMPGQLRQTLLEAGVVAQLMTPFGVGSDLLGIIVLQRMRPGRPWTPAEMDAMESVAADLGRGLNHARLYEAENRLVVVIRGIVNRRRPRPAGRDAVRRGGLACYAGPCA